MADATAAERQRRYRKHRKGDHSLCHAGRCDQVPVTDTDGVTRDAPRTSGERFWAEMTAQGGLNPDQLALIREVSRIVDRLDDLDRVIKGKGVLELMHFRSVFDMSDERHLVMTVDGVLAEARQQAGVLKQLISELRRDAKPAGKAPAKPKNGGEKPQTGGVTEGGAGIADLTALIAERRDNTAG